MIFRPPLISNPRPADMAFEIPFKTDPTKFSLMGIRNQLSSGQQLLFSLNIRNLGVMNY